MNRRYVLYSSAGAGALVLLLTTSYGALLLASVVAVSFLSVLLMTCIGVLSFTERIAHTFVRTWNAVVPERFMSMLFRQ